MATTYSTSLKLALIGDGDQAGIWGQTTNTNLGTLLEQAITGVQSITMVDANYTLTNFNGVTNEARNAVLVVTGTNNAVRDLIPPVVEKLYTIVNNTTGGFAIRVIGGSGTGVNIPNGATCLVYCDGTNFVNGLSGSAGSFSVNGILTVTGNTNAVAATYTGNVVALNYSTAGNVTAAGNVSAANFTGAGLTITSINASNISAGTIANAITTANSANGASTIVARDANGSFAGNVITGTTGTFTSISGNGVALTAINASNIASGTLAIARGGTGTGSTTFCNLTTNVTGTLPVANGGTGVTSSTGTGSTVLSASPTFTGAPIAPTASPGTNTTQIATTAFALANGVPSGAIILWSGSIGSIPAGYVLCNGSNGTPDLRDRFVVGAGSTYAVADTGGNANATLVSHTHTATSSVIDPGHTHTGNLGFNELASGPLWSGSVNSSGSTSTTNSNTTSITVATSISTEGSSATNANLPPYYALAYIMKA